MPPKKRGRPKKIAPPKEIPFKLLLTVGVDHYESEGETVLDALTALPKPRKVVLRGALLISKGDEQRMYALNIVQIKRLFYPVARRVLAKQYSFGFA